MALAENVRSEIGHAVPTRLDPTNEHFRTVLNIYRLLFRTGRRRLHGSLGALGDLRETRVALAALHGRFLRRFGFDDVFRAYQRRAPGPEQLLARQLVLGEAGPEILAVGDRLDFLGTGEQHVRLLALATRPKKLSHGRDVFFVFFQILHCGEHFALAAPRSVLCRRRLWCLNFRKNLA